MDCHRIVGVIQTDGKKVCIEREREREKCGDTKIKMIIA